MAQSHDKQIAVINQAIVNITNKNRPTAIEVYALNALRIALKIITDSDREKTMSNFAVKQSDSDIKYRHMGKEVIDVIRESVGDESAYIYCTCQVIKHLYLHEYDITETADYAIAEYYKDLANQLMKLHPEW